MNPVPALTLLWPHLLFPEPPLLQRVVAEDLELPVEALHVEAAARGRQGGAAQGGRRGQHGHGPRRGKATGAGTGWTGARRTTSGRSPPPPGIVEENGMVGKRKGETKLWETRAGNLGCLKKYRHPVLLLLRLLSLLPLLLSLFFPADFPADFSFCFSLFSFSRLVIRTSVALAQNNKGLNIL